MHLVYTVENSLMKATLVLTLFFSSAFVLLFTEKCIRRNSVTQVKPFFRGFFHIATCQARILIIKQ